MTTGSTKPSGASAADAIEAEIRKSARPMLSPEERAAAASAKMALQARWAAANCRRAAEEQLARAAEHEAEAKALEKGA